MDDGAPPNSRRRFTALLLAGWLAAVCPPQASAKDDGGGENEGGNGNGGGGGANGNGGPPTTSGGGNDGVLNAVKAGNIVPLATVLATVKQQYSGDVVKVRLVSHKTGPVYSIRVLGSDNRLIDVMVDAKGGKIIPAGLY